MRSVYLVLMLAAILSVPASIFFADLILPSMSYMFSKHMLSHILLMNVAAPFICWVYYCFAIKLKWMLSKTTLIVITIFQLLLLCFWHLPSVMEMVMLKHGLMLFMHFSLLIMALCFWLCVFYQAKQHITRALASLLVTGKLYCIFAVLLVFTPHRVYLGAGGNAGVSLDDQQLAGLMMVVACPLTYVLTAVILAAHWMSTLRNDNNNAFTKPNMPAT